MEEEMRVAEEKRRLEREERLRRISALLSNRTTRT
jgi:hypothetical protein